MFRKTTYKFFILLLFLAAAGCGGKGPKIPYINEAEPHVGHIRIVTDNTTNDNAPVEVALAYAMNDKVSKKLESMTADTFFKNLTQLKQGHPKRFRAWNWELIPGHQFDKPLPDVGSVKSAYLFVNYSAPGAHRVPIPPSQSVIISLSDNTIHVESRPHMDVDSETDDEADEEDEKEGVTL